MTYGWCAIYRITLKMKWDKCAIYTEDCRCDSVLSFMQNICLFLKTIHNNLLSFSNKGTTTAYWGNVIELKPITVRFQRRQKLWQLNTWTITWEAISWCSLKLLLNKWRRRMRVWQPNMEGNVFFQRTDVLVFSSWPYAHAACCLTPGGIFHPQVFYII